MSKKANVSDRSGDWAEETSGAFGAKLRALREAAQLTQQALADKTGLTREGVAQLEAGRRNPAWKTVLLLAHGLDVSCEAFQEQEPAPQGAKGKKTEAGKGRQK